MCHDYNVDKAVVGLPVHHVHLRYMYVSNLTEVCQLTSKNIGYEGSTGELCFIFHSLRLVHLHIIFILLQL